MAGDAVIVAGFGFRTSATAESLSDACAKARAAYAPGAEIGRVAAPDDKLASPALVSFARDIKAPAFGVSPADLVAPHTHTESIVSVAMRGTGSVAEAAALAAAGESARLLGPRCISTDGLAVCALAEGQST